MNSGHVAIVFGVLSLTSVGVVGCATHSARPSSNQSPSNQVATAPATTSNAGRGKQTNTTNTAVSSSHAGATTNTSPSRNHAGATTPTNTATSSPPADVSSGSQPKPSSRFPTIVSAAMQQFPANVLQSAKAPTVLPTSASDSSQMYYRTWDTTSGSILNYSVQLSSPHYRLATFMGSIYSGIPAGNSVWLPNGVPQNAQTTNETVDLVTGIVGHGQTFVAPKDSAKEVSSASISWTEGRWHIEVSRTQGTRMPIAEANTIASYLHSHFMPVPETKGSIFVNVYPGENSEGQPVGTAVDETIKWQEGTHVYEVDTYSHTKNPIETGLAMAISMKPYTG